MKYCPVCKKELTAPRCARCGYDESVAYEQYATLMPLERQTKVSSLAARRQKWNALNENSLRCQNCGGHTFWIEPKQKLYICAECWKTVPFAAVQPQADPSPSASRSGGSSKAHLEQVVPTISAGYGHVIALRRDGTVLAAGHNYNHKCDVSGWRDIVTVSAGQNFSFGMKADGDVLITLPFQSNNILDVLTPERHTAQQTNSGKADGRGIWSGWSDIVAVDSALNQMVGLKKDGTVVVLSDGQGQCDVSSWTDVVGLSVGKAVILGLKADGSVYATGTEPLDPILWEVAGWHSLIGVSAGGSHAVGLKRDGSVFAAGQNGSRQCSVGNWESIKAVSAGHDHTLGLRADGTVVATGRNDEGQCNVNGWHNIAAIVAGGYFSVGIRADGTAVSTSKEIDVSGWNGVKLP